MPHRTSRVSSRRVRRIVWLGLEGDEATPLYRHYRLVQESERVACCCFIEDFVGLVSVGSRESEKNENGFLQAS